MNNFRVLILLILFVVQVNAQETYLTSNGTYAQVHSYTGAQIPGAVNLSIHIAYEHILERGWQLDYRLLNPIQNSEGLTFPVEKLFLRVNNINASNALLSSPSQLGYVLGNVPMSYNYINLISSSPYKKDNIDYVQISTNFDLIVEGGSYLQEYKTYAEYPIQIEFRILDENGNVISTTASAALNMQVYPNDTPPVEVNYGIAVKGQARNAVLDFNRKENYRDGVEVEYPQAIQVTTNTDYFILVQSLYDKLYTTDEESISLSNIIVALNSDEMNSSGSVILSNTEQIIIQAPFNNISVQYYDLKYTTSSNSIELIEVPSGNYSTTLIYTITPQ